MVYFILYQEAGQHENKRKKYSYKRHRAILTYSDDCISSHRLRAFLFSGQNSKRITSQNREYLNNNAIEMARSIDDTLTSGYDNIRVLSSLFGQTLKSPEVDISGVQNMIANSVFDFMEFADTEGMDHNITGGVSDAKDRQYFLDAREGNVGMELIYKSRATHETLLKSSCQRYMIRFPVRKLRPSAVFREPGWGWLL